MRQQSEIPSGPISSCRCGLVQLSQLRRFRGAWRTSLSASDSAADEQKHWHYGTSGPGWGTIKRRAEREKAVNWCLYINYPGDQHGCGCFRRSSQLSHTTAAGQRKSCTSRASFQTPIFRSFLFYLSHIRRDTLPRNIRDL